MPVDTQAAYWVRSVEDDFSFSGHVAVPRIVAAKGLGFGTISASFSRIPDSEAQVWGAALDVPIIDGGVVRPTLAARGAWAALRGVEEMDLTTWGLELFLSKGFGPLTPYAAAGMALTDATGRVAPGRTLTASNESARFTVGVKLSLFIPKVAVEVTQGEERSYAARVSFGL